MHLTLAVLMILVAGLIAGQFAGNNIAFKKNATQLPGDYCDTPFCYTASLAVDGQVDDDGYLRRHCSHTKEQTSVNASWEVRFGGLHQITGIRIFNRKSTGSDILGNHLRNFIVIGINSKTNTEQLLYTDNYTFIDEYYPVVTEIALPNPPTVTGIRIGIPYRGEDELTVLTLCEVEVFSDFVCPNLTTDANTIISYSNKTNNGSVASYSCVPRYYLSENNYTLVCQIYQWSGPPAICGTMYCPLPLNISNDGYSISIMCASSKQNDSLPYNCSISINCTKGFNLTGKKDWVCLENGSWSGQEPVCQIVMCILPDKDQNGIQLHTTFSNGSSITTNSVSYGTEIHVFCDIGFKTSTEIKWTCTEDGSWNGTTHVCDVVTCDHPGNNSVINDAASQSSNTRAGLIGGVTGAVVVILIVTVIVVFVLIMRRRKHKTEEPSYFSSLQRQQREGEEYDNIRNANSSISTTEKESQACSNATSDQNGCGREYENTSLNTIESGAGQDYINA